MGKQVRLVYEAGWCLRVQKMSPESNSEYQSMQKRTRGQMKAREHLGLLHGETITTSDLNFVIAEVGLSSFRSWMLY